jgi:hypothetical protein
MRRMISGLRHWGHLLTRHLPDTPYPSDHPWRAHHDPARPRG